MSEQPSEVSVDAKSPDGTETKEERLARITARQAIIVTAITVCGGLAGAGIQHVASLSTNGMPTTTSVSIVKQDWLVIKGVELINATDEPVVQQVRIVATINNDVVISYPGPTIWEPVVREMPIERFPLPIGADTHKVTFVLFLRNEPGEPTTFHSQETITVTDTPFKSEARLVHFTPASRITGPQASRARVFFAIDTP